MKVKISTILSAIIPLVIAVIISMTCIKSNYWIIAAVIITYLTEPCWLMGISLFMAHKEDPDDHKIVVCIQCNAFTLICIYSMVLLAILRNLTIIGTSLLIIIGLFAFTELMLIISNKSAE